MVETITAQTVCLEGAPRFRDLGGIAAAEYQTIRRGILYRSEALWRLTKTDLGVLRALRLRTVCDLRGEPERLRSPHRWPDGLAVDVLNLDPAWVDEPRDERFLRWVRADFSETGAKTAMEDYYRRLPAGYAAHLPRLFSRLSDPRGIPAVILCQHGKDRTGFIVALVLSALGVSPAAIRDDYAVTGPVRHAEDAGRATQFFTAVLGHKPDPAAIDAVLASHLDCLNQRSTPSRVISARWKTISRPWAGLMPTDGPGCERCCWSSVPSTLDAEEECFTRLNFYGSVVGSGRRTGLTEG
jgi:protein-tyrosine phosphatase